VQPDKANASQAARLAWSEAKRIFAEALERNSAERAEYVARACGTNSELYNEVISLLSHEGCAESFFEHPFGEHPFGGVVSASADPIAGKRIGSYRVLRQIGIGGMGSV
jgi:eukaryotic-like serine/threonine-protein kinase